MAAKFDHIVVLMLENRSFDHMLGRLYHHDNPDPYHIVPRGQSFDGISDDMFNNLLPEGGAATSSAIKAHRATNYATPVKWDIDHSFDSVKLQINGTAPPGSEMKGFVASRIAALKKSEPNHTITQAEMGEPMAGFSPTTHNASGGGPFAAAGVIDTLARQFAVCDNWYASVPGPTFPNRSFLHAGTSNGFVSNSDPGSKPSTFKKWSKKHAPTIFNRLKDAKLKANIYHSHDGPGVFPALVYELHPTVTKADFPRRTFEQFQSDAGSGNLPEYSFIEPEIAGSDKNWLPNDQHPARDIRYGEDLIQQTYQAITSHKNWENTLFIITYDEHGGFFDHRFPPNAVPPSLDVSEEDYRFNQFGVRVPAVLVSPRIPAGTIFHPSGGHVDHTAVIHTICKRWNLPVLTTRDAFACDLSEVLTDTVRTDIPTIPKVQLPASQPNNLPLNDLQQDYLGLIAANRGIELPHLETEDDARGFMAKIAK
jgi:phospholipase C